MRALEFDAAMRLSGLTAFPEQVTIARYCDDALEDKRISLVEAPTATGKTMVIAWNALEAAKHKRAIIAVPSIDLLFQTDRAVEMLRSRSLTYRPIHTQIVMGRQEFTAEAPLLESFHGTSRLYAVQQWIKQGAPGAEAHHPRWTKHGLRQHLSAAQEDPSLPDEITLRTTDTDSQAAMAYAEQFNDEAQLFIVTHAMLALDLMARFRAASQWQRREAPSPFNASLRDKLEHEREMRLEADIEGEGRLPAFAHLIVDEAHVLADNVRNVLSVGIALSSLGKALAAAVSLRATPQAHLELRTAEQYSTTLAAG